MFSDYNDFLVLKQNYLKFKRKGIPWGLLRNLITKKNRKENKFNQHLRFAYF